MTLRYNTTTHTLEVETYERPGISRTTLCHRCGTTLHYSPIAKDWWHREHGSVHCALVWDEHMGDPPNNVIFRERGRVFFEYWGEPLATKPTPGQTAGSYWSEEVGDGTAIIHTPWVHDEETGNLVKPIVRRVGGGYVMEG